MMIGYSTPYPDTVGDTWMVRSGNPGFIAEAER